jgi:hypothetical protein
MATEGRPCSSWHSLLSKLLGAINQMKKARGSSLVALETFHQLSPLERKLLIVYDSDQLKRINFVA